LTRVKTARKALMPTHLRQRLAAVRQRLRRWNLPALLLTNPRDIRYLTGFVGDDSWALIAATGAPIILSDFRFQEQIAHEAPHAAIRIRKESLADELAGLLASRKLRGLALQSSYVTVSQLQTLRRTLGKVRLVAKDDGLLRQRAVKDRGEVDAIRKAIRIAEDAFCRTVEQARPGMTESHLAAVLEFEMRRLGADGPSFPSIVAAGANASLPHAIPGSAKLRRGGIVLIDWGARWGGYCSDLTRTISLGPMPARMREIYQVVLDAQLAGIAAVAPGRSVRQVDTAARQVIEKAGYGPNFGHGLGHGIGLDIHEQPTLGQRGQGILEPGQVVTVEPGIYLPGVGGVRTEDDVLVTVRGGQVLSSLPKDMASAIV
jgi:Xaa-Pro aminopeptidase